MLGPSTLHEAEKMNQEQITAAYVEHMGSDLSVVNAARQSFNKQKETFDEKDASLIDFLSTGMRSSEWDKFLQEIAELSIVAFGSKADESVKARLKERLLQYKRQAVHFAPFAHPHVTIRMRVPIFLARQLVKHQIGGTWSEESRRYMSDEPSFYFEPVLHKRPGDIKQGSSGEHENSLGNVVAMMGCTDNNLDVYKALLDVGVAPEEAREILTLNTMTGVTWTGSLLFWSRVVTQRVDPHAQRAAQYFARQVNDIMAPLFPVSWHSLVGNMPSEPQD